MTIFTQCCYRNNLFVLAHSMCWNALFIPHHKIVVGYYGIMLVVCVSAHLPVCCTSICIFFFRTITSKYQWILTKLDMCIYNEMCLGIADGQILSIFYRVISPQHDNGEYYCSTFLFRDNFMTLKWKFKLKLMLLK